jgi:hypothetical protein
MRSPATSARRRGAPIGLRPRYNAHTEGDLPGWSPSPPRGGWTLDVAEHAARAYTAAVLADEPTLDERRVAYAAFLELRRINARLSRAYLTERLSGRERFPRRVKDYGTRPTDPAPF